SGALGAKDTGFITIAPPNFGPPSALFYLNSLGSKIRPSITVQNNFQFVVNYAIAIPAGKTVSIVHGVAQRSVAQQPDAKTLATLFKPFKEPTWFNAVPVELRRTVINGESTGVIEFGDGADVVDTLSDLGVPRGPHDQLLLGSDTRLRGTLVCEDL